MTVSDDFTTVSDNSTTVLENFTTVTDDFTTRSDNFTTRSHATSTRAGTFMTLSGDFATLSDNFCALPDDFCALPDTIGHGKESVDTRKARRAKLPSHSLPKEMTAESTRGAINAELVLCLPRFLWPIAETVIRGAVAYGVGGLICPSLGGVSRRCWERI